jgi:DNA-directed RNA polymerase specialized sigma24 family protein
MDLHSEWLLVQRCRAGDKTAWQELYRVYHPGLTAWIKRRLHATGNALDEIAQATWVGLFKRPRHLEAFDPLRAPFGAYLTLVAMHYASHRWRAETARAAREEPLGAEPTTDEGSLPLGLMLEDVLSPLPPRIREVAEARVLVGDGSLARPPSQRCMRRVRERLSQCCREYVRNDNGPYPASVRGHPKNQAGRSPNQRSRPEAAGGPHAN